MDSTSKIQAVINCICKNLPHIEWLDNVYYIDKLDTQNAPIVEGQGNYLYFRRNGDTITLNPEHATFDVTGYTDRSVFCAVLVYQKDAYVPIELARCLLSLIHNKDCVKCIEGANELIINSKALLVREARYYNDNITGQELGNMLGSLNVNIISLTIPIMGDITLTSCNDCNPCGHENKHLPTWI